MLSNDDDDLSVPPCASISPLGQQPRSSIYSITHSATSITGTAAASAVTYTFMNAANVVLNTKLLVPLVIKLDQWIMEGIQQFQRWSEDQNDLAAQRYNHESLEDRIWNTVVANKFKVGAGGALLWAQAFV